MKSNVLLFTTFLAFSYSFPLQGMGQGDTLKNENAVILSEKNSVIITGKKADFIYFNIKKEIKVKINDSIGLRKYSKFVFPESFDPTYIYHNSNIRNMGDYLSKLIVNSFVGSITKANGETDSLSVSESINNIKSVGLTNYFEIL